MNKIEINLAPFKLKYEYPTHYDEHLEFEYLNIAREKAAMEIAKTILLNREEIVEESIEYNRDKNCKMLIWKTSILFEPERAEYKEEIERLHLLKHQLEYEIKYLEERTIWSQFKSYVINKKDCFIKFINSLKSDQ